MDADRQALELAAARNEAARAERAAEKLRDENTRLLQEREENTRLLQKSVKKIPGFCKKSLIHEILLKLCDSYSPRCDLTAISFHRFSCAFCNRERRSIDRSINSTITDDLMDL